MHFNIFYHLHLVTRLARPIKFLALRNRHSAKGNSPRWEIERPALRGIALG